MSQCGADGAPPSSLHDGARLLLTRSATARPEVERTGSAAALVSGAKGKADPAMDWGKERTWCARPATPHLSAPLPPRRPELCPHRVTPARGVPALPAPRAALRL